MTNYYFSPLAGFPQYNGKNILVDSGTVYNGNVVQLAASGVGGTSGSFTLSTGSGTGLAFDLRALTEFPTGANLVTDLGGQECNFLSGYFEAAVGPTLFTAGTIPAVNAPLYDNANGTISATAGGHNLIGRCLRHSTIRDKDVPNSGIEVAICQFNFVSNI